jgi:flagellin
MLSLHTNAASLSTQNSLASTNKALSSSMTKLGTGYRVNSAMDDAAGLQIATRLNAQTSGMSVAQKNTQNGISMLQTAEGALEISNMLIRMKDLATEAATATSSANDITAMAAEYDALTAEITSIMTTPSLAVPPGRQPGLDLPDRCQRCETYAFTATTFSQTAVAFTNAATATTAMGALDTDIAAISTLRSSFGAAANRLEHVYNNLGNMVQNTEAAKGRIMDVDYASETANMTNKQMLMQASSAMLKQSSSMSQMVASLLQ